MHLRCSQQLLILEATTLLAMRWRSTTSAAEMSLSFRQHVWSVLFLLVVSTTLLFHTIMRPHLMFGMANTDNEGTLWWLWTECKGYSSHGILTRIGWPKGFDTTDFASFNLIDMFRSRAARLGGCSPEAVVSIFSIFPVVALFLNFLAAYLLGLRVLNRRLWAVVLAVTGIGTSQILLATRTSLANNLLAPGLLALAFALRFLDRGKGRDAWLSACFLCLQMMCNAYNGAMFLIVLVVFSWSRKPEFRFRQWFVFPGILLIGSLIGLLPLIRTQLFLVTDSNRRDLIRPVNLNAEVINPLVLFSRNYHWFTSILQEKMPVPEAGWLSILVVLLALLVVGGLFGRQTSAESRGLTVGSFAASTLIILIACDIPGGEPLRTLYAFFGSPFRGVSNYLKIVPLLLAMGGLSILKEWSERRSMSWMVRCWLPLALTVLCVLNLWDSVPTSPTFRERTSLVEVADFYRSLPDSDKAGVTAHFPDYTYQPEWGMPLRFIQMAQMYTDEILANGRDFDHRHDRSSALPSPTNRTAFESLRKRGISRLVLHRNLVDPVTLQESVRFLESLGLRGIRYQGLNTNSGKEIYNGLNVIVFDIGDFRQTSSSWTLIR